MKSRKTKTPDDFSLIRAAGHDLISATDVHGMFQTGERFRTERIDYRSPWFGTLPELAQHLREQNRLQPIGGAE